MKKPPVLVRLLCILLLAAAGCTIHVAVPCSMEPEPAEPRLRTGGKRCLNAECTEWTSYDGCNTRHCYPSGLCTETAVWCGPVPEIK